ncbi:Shedu immune nuclease family protein [Nocardia nova]|uniref:Shedu immune nuclease family protein n=1 Tax=Nocardia nova TaxID=37330 RepID=UPI0025B04FC8|nr:Shedu immune nuclease family protein [Nocardia nova]
MAELNRLRAQHLELVARGELRPTSVAPIVPSPDTANRLQTALGIWEAERENNSEEFWQTLFTHRPELLKLVTQGRPFVLNSKCYVGGKAIDNRGGQVVDFLAQCSGDAILIEIKTPTAALMGREYRANVHPPSPELAGAVAQALNYRLTLLNEMAMLTMHSPGLIAHHPSIVVIVGDLNRAEPSAGQRRSFELYRQCMKDVLVVTYDELFTSLADLAVLMEPDTGM